MYLEVWEIIVLGIAFGLCAYISSWSGSRSGGRLAIDQLIIGRVVDINQDTGEIVPFPWRKTQIID